MRKPVTTYTYKGSTQHCGLAEVLKIKISVQTRSMQVYTSPVPAYLLSALPLHLPSIHTPHLWAHKLLSLCRFSVNIIRIKFKN